MSASDQPLTLSVFERLTDYSPSATREPAYRRWAERSELLDSVLSHLEALLNTRRSDAHLNPDYEEVNNTVVAYGICDYTSFSCADPAETQKLASSVERAIRAFEPRLARAEVRISAWNTGSHAVRLTIEGSLRIGLDREPILIEATLAKDSRQFEVREGA